MKTQLIQTISRNSTQKVDSVQICAGILNDQEDAVRLPHSLKPVIMIRSISRQRRGERRRLLGQQLRRERLLRRRLRARDVPQGEVPEEGALGRRRQEEGQEGEEGEGEGGEVREHLNGWKV